MWDGEEKSGMGGEKWDGEEKREGGVEKKGIGRSGKEVEKINVICNRSSNRFCLSTHTPL